MGKVRSNLPGQSVGDKAPSKQRRVDATSSQLNNFPHEGDQLRTDPDSELWRPEVRYLHFDTVGSLNSRAARPAECKWSLMIGC